MEPDPLSSSSNKNTMTTPPVVSFTMGGLGSPSLSARKSPFSIHDPNRSHLSAFTPVGPVLTPRGTPRGSHGLMLLSPARTITESLKSLATSTAQQLEEVWDAVGYNPEERATQLSDLLVKFRDLCEETIQEERAVAETFRHTIVDAKDEIRATAAALKALVDPRWLRDNSGQTLTEELGSLEVVLEGLRADADIAKRDLIEKRDIIIESHEALGLALHDEWKDIDSDLTAARREEFHLRAIEMKEEVATRTSAVIQVLRDCQHLMNDLGIDSQNGTPLDRRIAGSLVRSKDSSFIMASKFETETCTGLSSKALEELTQRVSELSGEKRRRKTKLQDMGGQIAVLWEQLRVPEEEQRAFTESVKGLGIDTVQKGEAELARLKALKGEMLGMLVLDARETIRKLWDETNATEAHRDCFRPIAVDREGDFDDDLLEKHEEYIRVLQSRLEQMKPIMRIVERREEILRERMEYEELQKDSDRLKQRGAAMAKQLMEEEKMARRIKRELPRLTKLLEEKLLEWKDNSGEDFQFRGEVYAETMARQGEEWAIYKQNEMELKLKKKQEEMEQEENKFLGKISQGGKKKKLGSRPLGDLDSQENKRASSRSRPRDDVSKSFGMTGGDYENRVSAV